MLRSKCPPQPHHHELVIHEIVIHEIVIHEIVIAEAPIFVVGSGRSGTSLMRALLNAHPRIHLSQETALLRWLDRWTELDARSFHSAWSETAAGRLHSPEPAEYPEHAPAIDALRGILRGRAASRGKARWGDKTPLHALHLGLLWAHLPEARVVAMVRHPVPTVASLRRMPWSSGSLTVDSLLVRHTLEHITPDPRLLRVRLEDLLASPERCLREVLAFLDEDWAPEVLDHAHHADFSGEPRLPWLTSAEGPLRPHEARPLTLSAAQVAMVEGLCPPQSHGYQAWSRPRGTSGWLPLLGDLPRVIRSLWALRPWALPSSEPLELSARDQLRWLLSLNPEAACPDLADAVLDAAPRLRGPEVDSPSTT